MCNGVVYGCASVIMSVHAATYQSVPVSLISSAVGLVSGRFECQALVGFNLQFVVRRSMTWSYL